VPSAAHMPCTHGSQNKVLGRRMFAGTRAYFLSFFVRGINK
jgi:hypothetical protein